MTSNMSSVEASNKKEAPAAQVATGGDNVPSGFILKLFQMVNGAPDEVIRVSDFDSLRPAWAVTFWPNLVLVFLLGGIASL